MLRSKRLPIGLTTKEEWLLKRYEDYLDAWDSVFRTHRRYKLGQPNMSGRPYPWDNLYLEADQEESKILLKRLGLHPVDWNEIWEATLEE